jgi:hypothetical protein
LDVVTNAKLITLSFTFRTLAPSHDGLDRREGEVTQRADGDLIATINSRTNTIDGLGTLTEPQGKEFDAFLELLDGSGLNVKWS